MRALVVGAGISGLAAAIGLHQQGWQVIMVERSPGPRRQGYMIDFFGPGYDAAEEMGLLPAILDVGHRIAALAYLDENGRRRAGMDFSQFARLFDGRLTSVMRPDLEAALTEALPAEVELRYGTSIDTLVPGDDHEPAQVLLTDGTELELDVVIGADGLHSTVRDLVWGGDRLVPLGFHTAAFIVPDAPQLQAKVGNRFCLTDTVGREVGCYPIADGVAVFTVHRSTDRELPADPVATLHDTYAGLGWIVPELLERCPAKEEIYYDLVAQSDVDQWHRGRVVLIGDACHAVSLLAGQGASLGLAGAHRLALALGGVSAPDQITEALAAYEAQWRPRTRETQLQARKGVTWFLPAHAWQLRIRRWVLRASALPGVARAVARSLVGKPG
ncbi:FAD-dependent monooxygenase [Propionibacteriaceae bacterium Y1685]